MINLTTEQIKRWLEYEEDEFYIDRFRLKHEIAPDSDTLYQVFTRLVKEKGLKRLSRGLYRRIKQVDRIRVGNVDPENIYDFSWPKSHKDNSGFYFNELFDICDGDMIVITGVSDAGKTALITNVLAENVDKHSPLLMGNEYANIDGLIYPRFYKRLKTLSAWSNLFNGSGELNFECLPVQQDFEDYVQPNRLNIIDWIDFRGDWTVTSKVLNDIKRSVGAGVAVVVLQKKRGMDFAMGGEQSEQYAEAYIKLDPLGDWETRLTLGKIKGRHKGVRTYNRMWGFEIVDSGASLINIREITACKTCHGKGKSNFGVPCQLCIAKGYIDKEDF